MESCLLDAKVVYKDSEECISLLEQGPCNRGEGMVLGVGDQGLSNQEKWKERDNKIIIFRSLSRAAQV